MPCVMVAALALAGACRTGDLAEAEERALRSADALEAAAEVGDPLEPGQLRIRLIFGGEADLDLFVTDPLAESVYFANNPSSLGGLLDADRRCGDPDPRIETVVFEEAPAGRYRVGVDFPERCDGASEPVGFLIVVERDATRTVTRHTIHPGHFLAIVRELGVSRDPGLLP